MSSLNLKEQIQAELARNGISFNIILVGESGLGKSTCIRALFRPFVDRPGHPEDRPSTPAWLAPCHDEIRPRTLTIVEYGMSVESDGIPVEFGVLDCPGYGDQLDANDSIAPILACIRGRFGAHFEALQTGGAGGGRAALDGRVHACLYFIGAHRLKGIDIAFMRALQAHVPILPLIGAVRCGAALCALGVSARQE
jgi:septin family protein